MKCLTIGILAHVDSGKTTLSEGLLYVSKMIRKMGRVDHKDAFLDTNEMERERGITIFSKQARLTIPEKVKEGEKPEVDFTLLDTPGHVDFSAEMERTLSVLDYAILVVSGSEGVQSHTETLWKLLEHSHIPTMIFVNKMDIANDSQSQIMEQLQTKLSNSCIDFSNQDENYFDALGSCDEILMEQVLETGKAEKLDIAKAILQRHVFPCLFGSALKMDGVQEFWELLNEYTIPPENRQEFGAKVYKITEDEQGKRLTHLKVTGGILKVRDILHGVNPNGEAWEEKVSQLRLYSGEKFVPTDEVYSGQVCAVTGLSQTFSGEGLGTEQNALTPILEPILRYSVILPSEISVHTALMALRKLEEEDPQLHVQFNEQLQEIQVLLMGEIQLDVLQHLLQERFQMKAEFQSGGVAYKETIAKPIEGMGHYEPLRHYAEVRLLLEPLEHGKGLIFTSSCREDDLDRNWQRLILTHLAEKQHIGILTGSPITDMKITLLAGRAHKKHTEGGDFRQATYRAVRNGLMRAENILLEPWVSFRLEIPSESLGRAMTDLQTKGAKLSPPENSGENAILEGSAPAIVMMTYRTNVMEYTRGRGRLICTPSGYEPCANAEEVISRINYNPEADLHNSPDSIFCSHGAGELVKWDAVENRMHTESPLKQTHSVDVQSAPVHTVRKSYTGSLEDDKELMAIFEKTYGAVRRDKRDERHNMHTEKSAPKSKPVPLPKGKEYLLVDGYNIIFAWDELKQLAGKSLDLARNRLIHLLSNYRGYRQCKLILVFDAYKVKGNTGSITEESGISIVYTKEAETADTYIERVSHDLAKEYRVRVATSDGAEQVIIFGAGAYRMTAEELRYEIMQADEAVKPYLKKT
ncbi:MAG TPA: translation elongation factor G [Ruminococcus sp.]|nr:translation elongation factor G [Ruminococcus sp.]